MSLYVVCAPEIIWWTEWGHARTNQIIMKLWNYHDSGERIFLRRENVCLCYFYLLLFFLPLFLSLSLSLSVVNRFSSHWRFVESVITIIEKKWRIPKSNTSYHLFRVSDVWHRTAKRWQIVKFVTLKLCWLFLLLLLLFWGGELRIWWLTTKWFI